MTIAEFLLARIAEDEEREVRKYRHRDDLLWGCRVSTHSFDPQYVTITPPSGGCPVKMTEAEFRERYTEPAPDERVLAECKAKRAIIRQASEVEALAAMGVYSEYSPYGLRYAMCALAAVYADHSDYDPEWAPA